MLSNAYFLAKFRFDTAENEPAKNLQNFRKMHFSKMHLLCNPGCPPSARRRRAGGSSRRRCSRSPPRRPARAGADLAEARGARLALENVASVLELLYPKFKTIWIVLGCIDFEQNKLISLSYVHANLGRHLRLKWRRSARPRRSTNGTCARPAAAAVGAHSG